MEMDVYAPCPCGSGKKLKFCCAPIVDDMAKVSRLMASEQPRQALQIIERLEKAHPENPWVVTKHAELLIEFHQPQAAKERLEKLVKVQPDYFPAATSLAIASVLSDGYEAARPVVYRALQKTVGRDPESAGTLALALGALMQDLRHEMSARQYLSLAMRLLGEEAREDVFVMLLRLDGNQQIPYPLRNVHNLGTYPDGGPHAADAAKANALSGIGCWGPAARAFARIAEQEPHNAVVWRNIGLCRAWDADEAGAAEAFHRAAEASDDFEQAVECETLAQLFDLKTTNDAVPLSLVRFPVRSASRLLGRLDGNDRLTPIPVEQAEVEGEAPIAGEFIVRDLAMPAVAELEQLPADRFPVVAGTLIVVDAVPEHKLEAVAFLRGFEGHALDSAKSLIEELAGDELAGPSTSESDPSEGRIPREQEYFFAAWQLPAKTPATLRNSLFEARWRQLVEEKWLNAPQAALGGKSPSAAKGDGDPALRVRLTAAVYVLDALVQQLTGRLDFEALLKRLELDPPQTLEPGSVTLSALSPMQLHRLPVSRLTDAQLIYVHRRSLLVGHRRFLESVLKEVVARPQCLEQVDADRVFQMLVDIVRTERRMGEAVAWAHQARERAATSKAANAFEKQVTWTLTEFGLRSEQPDDPELEGLYRILADSYAHKVPQIAALLEAFRQQYADQIAWLSSAGLLVGSGAGATTPGGIWTPSSAASPSPAGGGKLWIPGQD